MVEKSRKKRMKKFIAFVMALSLVITSITFYTYADGAAMEKTIYTRHSKYLYLISQSTGKVVTVNETTTDLTADGDLSMLENVESMPDNALFDFVDSTDNRFVGYKSFRSVFNHQAVSARSVNEGGLRANGGQSTSGWEVMRFETAGDGTYAIRTANGYSNDISQGAYVQLDENNELIPGNTNIAEAEKFIVVFPEGYEEDTTFESSAERPAIPENLDISYQQKNITLTWEAVQNAVTYEIYRSTGKYSTYKKIGTSDTTSFTDTVTDSVYKYYYKVTAVNAEKIASEQSEAMALDIKLFGNTLNLYSPTDDVNTINSQLKAISDVQMKASLSEFTDNRYAIVFKPGDYNINTVNIGFYTQVLGLGKTPYETKIRNINVDKNESENVLINFWRGIENLYIESGSPENEVKYGASQAAPMRRLYVNGKLHLDDIGRTASGGFLADTYVTGQTGSWSQQQFFVRNTHMTDSWYDSCWNMLFLGCYNAPASSTDWANTSIKAYTTIDNTPVIREKPFLYVDDNGEYAVFVPGIRKNAADISWAKDDMGGGKSINLRDFYVAKADTDNAETLNAALQEGKHILFTPGIYEIEKPLEVTNPDTVILGLGLATLVCKNTDTAIKTADVDGISIAGLVIEAGAQGSDTLIQVGAENSETDHSDNPVLLSDLFFRVGGARIGKTEKCLEINSDDVIGDHFWIWRADHGAGANWNESTAKNGLVVNGDDVTVYGLFVEHFQQYQTLWNGNNGRTYFYQSELPYDVPYQKDWIPDNGANGYASYKVADEVEHHEATALGIYEVFIHTKEFMTLDNAMEVSHGTKVMNACTVSLSGTNPDGKGKVTHIVNGQGGSVGTGGISETGAKVGINIYCEDIEFLKEELKGIIEQYENTQKEDATDEAWKKFQDALTDAGSVYDDMQADANDIYNAENQLTASYKGLKENKAPQKEPLVSEKKGIGSWYYASGNIPSQRNVSLFNKIGATWLYNWGATEEVASEAKEAGLEYVPMVWGAAYVNTTEINKLKDGAKSGIYKNLLAFNEPDLNDQSNMTVDQAIELWPQLESTGLRLGSPAGAAVEDAWVSEFMARAKELGYRVDFLTLHVYQDFTHPGSVESFRQALERLHNKYQIPIWITEIGNVDVSTQWQGYKLANPMSHELAVKYIKEVGKMLESLDYVERYAWFVDYSDDISGTEYTRLYDINTGDLTEEGMAYSEVGPEEKLPDETAPTQTEKPSVSEESKTTKSETSDVKETESFTPDQTTKIDKVTLPSRVKIKSAIKKKSSKKVKIRLKKICRNAKGYQICFYKTRKNAKKNKKAILKIKYRKNKKKFTVRHRKLRRKKVLYIRMKAYIRVKGKTYYSKKWSAVRRVKIKK